MDIRADSAGDSRVEIAPNRCSAESRPRPVRIERHAACHVGPEASGLYVCVENTYHEDKSRFGRKDNLNPGPAGPQVESGGSGPPGPPSRDLNLFSMPSTCNAAAATAAQPGQQVSWKPLPRNRFQVPWKNSSFRRQPEMGPGNLQVVGIRPIQVCIDDSPMAYKNNK